MEALPSFVLAERDALQAEIHQTFEAVALGHGVSSNESRRMFGYPSEDRIRAARASDHLGRWQELLNDPDWSPWSPSWGFLDAKGYLFYIAPSMVWSVREGDDAGLFHHLRPDKAVLEDDQRQCVARYLRYMTVVVGLRSREAHEGRAALERWGAA